MGFALDSILRRAASAMRAAPSGERTQGFPVKDAEIFCLVSKGTVLPDSPRAILSRHSGESLRPRAAMDIFSLASAECSMPNRFVLPTLASDMRWRVSGDMRLPNFAADIRAFACSE